MTLYRDQGVVLRTFRLGEADRIVTMLCRSRGKVRAVAKGVRKTRSKFGGRLEPLSHVTLLVWQGRELDIVNQAEVLDSYAGVRQDLGRLAQAYAMAEVADQLAAEGHANARLYELLVGALRALEREDAPLLAPSFFLKALAAEGSGPILDACASCGEADGELVAFDLGHGGALCRSCRTGRPLSPAALRVMRRILGGGLAEALREPEGPVTAEVADVATEAMEAHLERRLRARELCTDSEGSVAAPFGVYVHVPFCASRCDYCAFATWTDRDHLMARYASACAVELRGAGAAGALAPATSVFVGGGTPSRLDPAALGGVLAEIPRADGAEVTVECNPEDASAARFAAWRRAGVTRVSFGVQSMAPHVLAGLGRRHDPATVERAAALASTTFPTWSLDLIIGGAGETDADWANTLDAALALGPPHLSCYLLTVEPGTPLAGDSSRHPDPDAQADRYERADAACAAAGLQWYEVSNWARPGHECRHNQLYWSQGDYRGIGCAAHSHGDGVRWWNVRTPERYIAAVEAGRDPMAGSETLTDDERSFERLSLSLRTARGVPFEALDPSPEVAGLWRRQGSNAVLTVRGRLLANEVTMRLRGP